MIVITKILALFSVALGMLAGPNAFAGPIGLSASDAAASAKQILMSNPGAANGFYWFDPDGASGDAAFTTYADMTTAGGGWMLGVHSVNGSESPSTDMVQNLGASSLLNGFNRDLSYWAVDRQAQIRHRMVGTNGAVLFDGYYTGKYHDPLGTSWTILTGDLNSSGLYYHLGMGWTTPSNDLDYYPGNCSALYGNQPWYYQSCWTVHPTSSTNVNGAYGANNYLATYDIYVRELQTPPVQTPSQVPEPASLALLGLGILGLLAGRRRSAKCKNL